MTWNLSMRSKVLSHEVGASFHGVEITYNFLFRNLFSILWTLYVLIKKRPRIIYLQYSYMLLLTVALYKILHIGKVVVICDCHTKALRRKISGRWKEVFLRLKKASFSCVDLCIVSNQGMVKDIKSFTASYYILPDKIPNIESASAEKEKPPYCVYISSFASDEPHDIVFEAAKEFHKNFNKKFVLYCTGRVSDKFLTKKNDTLNVVFTGFLPYESYCELLSEAQCILALTTEPDTLQCGAYEALALETPVILSNSAAQKSYFSDAAVYTEISVEGVINAIRKVEQEKSRIIANLIKVKNYRQTEFSSLVEKLKSTVDQL